MELENYKLDDELFNNYDFNVQEIVPSRNIYLIITDEDEKYLKKISFPVCDLDFIYDSLSYIRRKFGRIVSIYKTKEGGLYTNYKGSNYIVLNKVDGREGSFINPIDIMYIADALSELHSASKGLKCSLPSRDKTFQLISGLQDKLYKMDTFYEMGSLMDGEFSKIFQDNFKEYKEDAEESINLLKESDYYNLCKDENCLSLNHHDLAHHNIIINEDKAYFIDFDYAVYDLRVHDLANFINKTIKNFNYDFEKCESILAEYNRENSLNHEENKILYSMLLFPLDFYNLIYNYYMRNKTWSEEEFLNKLKDKIEKNQWRKIFLKELKKIAE